MKPVLPLLLFLAAPALAQGVLVNEVLASNQTVLADPDFGEFSDWIELHNPTAEAVDLGGFFLSDDLDDTTDWRIPDGTVLAPGGYLLVWADDRNSGPPETTGLHTSFRLSAGGEAVGLFDPDGAVVDSVTFGPQTSDVSYGRVPGTSNWDLFTTPTPGAANGTQAGIASVPTLDLASGFYGASESLAMSTTEADAVIRYTLDGSPPTDTSPAYTGPIPLTQTTVVSAAAFAPGRSPSPAVSRAYFVNEASDLPVISLVTDPDGFFSNENGIYVEGTNGIPGRCRTTPVNWNQDWEREALMSFFEPDGMGGFTLAMEQRAGVKIFGGCSRIYPQKSLSLHARGRYGADAFEHQIFPDLDIDRFDDLVLRTSAQDWWRTMFRDGMIQTLTRGLDLDGQRYRPAIVFLNGEYWGIHNLREKLNEDWVEAHYGVPQDDVEILDNGPLRGDSEHYDALLSIVDGGNLNDPAVFAQIEAFMDVDAYLDYLVAEIYPANADWPGNNLKLWRPDEPGGRWRWFHFDLDFGYGGNGEGQPTSNTLALATEPNGPIWPNPPWSTYLFRSLLQNDGFRHAFIQRMALHTATTFDPDRTLAVIDSLQATIASEVPRHKARWPRSISFGSSWDALIDIMRDFARRRPQAIRGHVTSYFDDVVGSARLSLGVVGGGEVHAEGIPMPRATPDDPFGPILYRGVPVQLVAVPDEGYVFTGWSGASDATSDTLALMLTASVPLTATFALATDTEAGAPPVAPRLAMPYPNPVTTTATVEVTLAQAGPLSLRVVDLLGREILTLADGEAPAGVHSHVLDVRRLPSGVYAVVMETEGYRAVRRVVVTR
ncbi:MAG: CotH kinase family protein [Bacteroidota bacterium]